MPTGHSVGCFFSGRFLTSANTDKHSPLKKSTTLKSTIGIQ